MTMTSNTPVAAKTVFEPTSPIFLRTRGGHRMLWRGAKRVVGASFSLAALALWLVPAGAGDSAEMLSKLIATLILGVVGATFWQAGAPAPAPEIEIDMIRREVRLVRWYGKTKSLVTRHRFADLSGADFQRRNVQLWDKSGNLLADLTMPDDILTRSLHRALQDSHVSSRATA